MPLPTTVVSYDLSDLGLVDFDTRRTKVYAVTNIPGGTVVDTDGNRVHLGSANGTLAADGTGSITVVAPGTGSNPDTWQTSIVVDYPDRRARDKRSVRRFGPFTITEDANLADLVEEQEVPPTYLSIVTTQLDGYVTEAETAATQAETAQAGAEAAAGTAATDAAAAVAADLADEVTAAQTARTGAEAAAALATDISNIDTSDAAIDAALQLPDGLAAARLSATYVQNGWYDDFTTDTDWQDNWTATFRAPGEFVVENGKGRLITTGPPTAEGADTYLKSRDIPFRSGFTVVAQSSRTANNGQMTEFEMGADGHGPIWHFEWSNNALIFWRQVMVGGAPTIVQETPVSIGAGDVLRFGVTCSRRTIDFTVLNVTTGKIAMSGVYDLDFDVSAEFDERAHLNFVTTGTAATTEASPVAQDIEFVRLTYLPTGDGGEAVYRKLYASGGNVVTRADGKTAIVQTGVITNMAGGGVAPGGIASNSFTFPVQFPGAPVVTLTPVANVEGGGEGDCKAWLKGDPTSSGFVARVKNEVPAVEYSGRRTNAAGGGVGAGATATVTVTFPAAFADVPSVQLAVVGNREGGGDGASAVWLQSVSATQFVAIVKNEDATTQTLDLHWSARHATTVTAQTIDLHWRAEYAI